MSHPFTDEELAALNEMFDLARAGDLRLLEVVDAGLTPNLTNHAGDTLLALAAYHQHPNLVRGLVERGADLDRVNDRGQTALGCAVFRQDAESVRVLVHAGADPDAGGRSARDVASFFGLDEMAALLG